MFIFRRYTQAIFACVLGIAIFGRGAIQMYTDTDMLRNGTQVVGQVIDTSIEIGGPEERPVQIFQIHFTYQDTNGISYTHKNQVSEEAYGTYTIGQSIDVYYYPDKPNDAITDIDGKVATNRLFLGFGGGLAIVGFALLMWLESKKD